MWLKWAAKFSKTFAESSPGRLSTLVCIGWPKIGILYIHNIHGCKLWFLYVYHLTSSHACQLVFVAGYLRLVLLMHRHFRSAASSNIRRIQSLSMWRRRPDATTLDSRGLETGRYRDLPSRTMGFNSKSWSWWLGGPWLDGKFRIPQKSLRLVPGEIWPMELSQCVTSWCLGQSAWDAWNPQINGSSRILNCTYHI